MNTYLITRNGQIFGPYTDAEVRQYIASGNILLTDFVQLTGTTEWVPVPDRFPPAAAPFATTPHPPRAAMTGARLFPDPPDLPWWVALLLGIATGGIFFVVWDIVQAAWVRRIQPTSNVLALYIGLAVIYLLRLPSNWSTVRHNILNGPLVEPHHGFLLFIVWLGLFIAARHTIRQDLLRHFNGPEPLGLRLNSFWVYLLGGLYLQYHFNRINESKRALRISVPA